jgi:hypothetical protein
MKRVLNMCVAAGLVLLASSQSQAQGPAPVPAPASAPASAQYQPPAQGSSWKDRGFITLNFAQQIRSAESVTSTTPLAMYGETGEIKTTQDMNGKGSFFGHGGGVRVKGNFGVGFAFSRVSNSGTWTGTARVPHPVIYDSPRTVTMSFADQNRVEKAYHFQIVWVLPLGEKLDVMASAGPTYFRVEQDVVGDPGVGEVGSPYSTVQMTDIAAVTSKIQKWGFNVGADVTYKIDKNFGVGGFVRYSGTTVNVDSGIRAAFDTKVGGIQVGGGLRIRF